MSDLTWSSFRRDERGAMMVLGLFMCTTLVGLLWYLAGLGDAILFRERLQEAADSVAFSDAALHARGMNLVVLINLVMAAVLAVRVAIRVAKLGIVAASLAFSGLSLINPGFAAVVGILSTANSIVTEVDTATAPVIDQTLKGLVAVQSAVATGVPTYAHLVSGMTVGEKYNVRAFALPGAGAPLRSLPVERRRPDKLCGEAGGAIGKLNSWLLGHLGLGGLGGATSIISDIFESIASSSPSYFCGLEAGAALPNVTTRYDMQAIDARCEDILYKGGEGEKKRWDEAENAWLKKCSQLGVGCSSRDANGLSLARGVQQGAPADNQSRHELEQLKLQRDLEAENMSVLPFRRMNFTQHPSQCRQWGQADMAERRQASQAVANKYQSGASSGAGAASSQGVAPMLTKDFRNGAEEGQMLAIVQRANADWTFAAAMVRVADVSKATPKAPGAPGQASLPSMAQSEFFYDCEGSWKSASCDDDDESLWHFQWRARLRRVNRDSVARLVASIAEAPGLDGLQTHELFTAKLAANAVSSLATTRLSLSMPLRLELAGIFGHENTRKYGVH